MPAKRKTKKTIASTNTSRAKKQETFSTQAQLIMLATMGLALTGMYLLTQSWLSICRYIFKNKNKNKISKEVFCF